MDIPSVVLHGSLDWSAGASVPVDLSQAASFSLFPGQVVAMDCSNPTGAKLISTKVQARYIDYMN